MDYSPIKAKLKYWIDFSGSTDEYRKKHDQDCILTDGNLFADTLFSLWLPLRYTLNHFDCDEWKEWKAYELKELKPKRMNLKSHNECLNNLHDNIEIFLPDSELSNLLSKLFSIGVTRSNVIILPYRKWNSLRGSAPYYDYFPHFLYDLFGTDNKHYIKALEQWIKEERLEMFFTDGITEQSKIKDLIGNGNVTSHKPNKMNLERLFSNYLYILNERSKYL